MKYPLTVKDELVPHFKREINQRIIPGPFFIDVIKSFCPISSAFQSKSDILLGMNCSLSFFSFIIHQSERKLEADTGCSIKILSLQVGVYKNFRSENWMRRMGTNLYDEEKDINPEVEMNREEYNEKNYWDYWSIYSIKSLSLEIQFNFRENNPAYITSIERTNINLTEEKIRGDGNCCSTNKSL